MIALPTAAPAPGVDRSYAEQLPPWLTFDQFGRYSLIREALAAAREPLGRTSLRVLDVGAYTRTILGGEALPVRDFLPADDVLALDQVPAQLPGYVQGNGTRLDFADDSFDFVVSADTLEHVPELERPAFIAELLRVARLGLVLVAPTQDPATDAAEELLLAYIRAEHGVTQIQLAEHRTNGLPRLDPLTTQLNDYGYKYYVYPSGFLHSWLAMMLLKFYMQKLTGDTDLHMAIDQYYIRHLSAEERREPSYRHGVVVAKRNEAGWIEAVEAALRPTVQPAAEASAAAWQGVAGWLADVATLRHANGAGAATALAQTINAQQAQLATLTALLAEREARLADAERRAGWYREQAEHTRAELRSVANGRVLRLLTWLFPQR